MPVAGAGTDLDLDGAGERAVGSPPWRLHHPSPHVHGPAVGQHGGGVGVVEPGQVDHLTGEVERELDHVGRSAAGQHLDRFDDLERVAGRAPSGTSICVSSAVVRTSWAAPSSTMTSDSSRACPGSFMNAPDPTFTSRTRAWVPSAIFFDMIELAMSGIDSTVPVMSRRA